MDKNRIKIQGVGWVDAENVLDTQLLGSNLVAFNAYIRRKHQGWMENPPNDFEWHGEQIVGDKDVYSIFEFNLFKDWAGRIGLELERGISISNAFNAFVDDTELWAAALEKTFGEKPEVIKVDNTIITFLECLNVGWNVRWREQNE